VTSNGALLLLRGVGLLVFVSLLLFNIVATLWVSERRECREYDDALYKMARTNSILSHTYLGLTFIGFIPICLRRYQYRS
jgi:hypothetical protein